MTKSFSQFIRQRRLGIVTLILSVGIPGIFLGALWWRTNSLNYELYVPVLENAQPLPAIVVLHGTGGDAVTTERWLGFNQFADKHGFVVIYPNSSYEQWDAGIGVLESGNSKYRKVDHVEYINRILDAIIERYPVDINRVVIGGISDGAAMAVHATCRLPEVFTGVFSVAATIPIYAIKNCETARPISALFMHGIEDNVLPWAGKFYKGYKIYLPFDESIDRWLTRNRCNQGADQGYLEFAGEVDWKRFADCEDGTHVTVYRINNGGHTWPLRSHPEGRSFGAVNQDIDATKIIVDWAMALH